MSRNTTTLTLVAALTSSFLLHGVCQAQVKPLVKQDVVDKIAAALPKSAPAKPKKPRKVLLFSKTNGFRHGSIATGVTSLAMLGEKTGAFSAVHSEDDSMFEPETLKQFDLVIMVNTTGELFRPRKLPGDAEAKKKALDREERLKQSLVDFVNGGKGLAGTHSATDTYKKWKEYNDMMGGAFAGHPWHMDVPVRLLVPDHPLNKVSSEADAKTDSFRSVGSRSTARAARSIARWAIATRSTTTPSCSSTTWPAFNMRWVTWKPTQLRMRRSRPESGVAKGSNVRAIKRRGGSCRREVWVRIGRRRARRFARQNRCCY